jgi:hypothetical protein
MCDITDEDLSFKITEARYPQLAVHVLLEKL